MHDQFNVLLAAPVLVQPEVESRRTPLASIPSLSASQFRAPLAMYRRVVGHVTAELQLASKRKVRLGSPARKLAPTEEETG